MLFVWEGQHKRIPYATYKMEQRCAFVLKSLVDTHELVISVTINESTKLFPQYHFHGDRTLYQETYNYGDLPGKSADEVAQFMLYAMANYLLGTPDPLQVPGLYHLAPDKSYSPWSYAHATLFRKSKGIACRGWRFD